MLITNNKIIPIGTVYIPDEEGFIVNNFSLNDINEDNRLICNYLVEKCISFYGENLHSVYARGSLLNKSSLLPNADKDFIIVLLDNCEYSLFEKKYQNFISTLNSDIYFDISLNTPHNLTDYQKFESVCLYGHDLSVQKVVFKDYVLPMVIDYENTDAFFFAFSCHHNQSKDIVPTTNKELLSKCKVILRAAMVSVALELNKYSRDLYYCCKLYEEYYPHQGKYMWDLLSLYLNPTKYNKLILNKAIQCLLRDKKSKMKSNIIFNELQFYENVFTEEQNNKIWDDYLGQGNWEYGHGSTETSKNKFWYSELFFKDFFTDELFSSIQNLIGNNFEILRCYANGHTAFQGGEYHVDSSEDDEYTFLYYPMQEWRPEWGGETIFQLPSGALQYVLPIPNGAVLFPGSWPHCGRAPVLEMPYGLRVTIAYKLKLITS